MKLFISHFTPILLLGLVISLTTSKPFDLRIQPSQDEGPGEPLYLTPLIKEGRTVEAREAAVVTGFEPVQSFSGFITVNETHNSNLFFWFFPAEESYNGTDNGIPLMIWSDGGPGGTCITTIFSPSGPFLHQEGFNFTSNPLAWNKKYHRIFLDNPVEVGFSHTDGSADRVYSSVTAAKYLYEFLNQFFKMFPELQDNPFYTSGVSYGGRYSTELAHLIHTSNQNNPETFINLKGLIEDSPWFECKTQIEYANVLYGAGVISKAKRDEYLGWETDMRRLIDEGSLREAFNIWFNYALADVPATTGYVAIYDLIIEDYPTLPFNMTELLELNSTRRAIHVGNITHAMSNPEIISNFAEDLVGSSAAKLDELLKSDYKMLMLVGNVDVITGHMGFKKLFDETMTWEGSHEFVNGNRSIWQVGDKIAGYLTKVGNAELAIVRNAPHAVNFAKPEWVLELLTEFLG